MKRFFLGISALAAFFLLISGGARADSPQAPKTTLSGQDIATQVQNVDDATLQKSAQTQADRLRELPNELREQGIAISAEQEAAVNQAADTLQAQATQPDFKEKVEAALKSMGSGLKVMSLDVAKDAGKGIGYAGTAVLAASFAPVTFTGDLVLGIAVGHGEFSTDPVPSPSPSSSLPSPLSSSSDDSDPNVDTVAGHFEYEGAIVSGIGGMYLAYVGLDALGYTLGAPVIGTALGIVTVNWLVCSRFDNSDNPELSSFCSNNLKIAGTILGGSARGGAIIGEGIHKGLLDAVHFIEKPFRKKKAPVPAPSPSADVPNPAPGSPSLN